MTIEEYNNTVVNKYLDMGLDKETAKRLANSTANPVSGCLVSEETNKPSTKKAQKTYNFDNLSNVSNFSFTKPKVDDISSEGKVSYIEKTRAKKEDILNALFTCLTQSDTLINTSTVQLGKAGTIYFKNNNNDYFTLKLTLNKSKPADFIE